MKVLLFFSFEMSLKDWSNAGLLKREILLYRKLMDRYGVQVSLLTFGNKADRRWEEVLEGIELISVYEKINYTQYWIPRVCRTFLIPWVFRKELGKVDLFKTNQMMGAWVAVIAKVLFRKPVLLRCGYELSEFFRLGNNKWWRSCGVRILSTISYHLADRIHVVTQDDANIVRRRYKIAEEKIEVRHNWVDTKMFGPSLTTSSDDKNVLFVGRFSQQKNVYLLIDAIVGTQLKLSLVGIGEEECTIRQRASERGVAVTFMGQISNDEMPNVYRRCAIYVLCSRYEGNPKTLLEAMSCGCAVVGTDVPGIANVIQHEVNGLLVSEQASSLRGALLRLSKDSTLRHRLGSAARNQIMKENSLDAAVQKEWRAYRELVPTTFKNKSQWPQ